MAVRLGKCIWLVPSPCRQSPRRLSSRVTPQLPKPISFHGRLKGAASSEEQEADPLGVWPISWLCTTVKWQCHISFSGGLLSCCFTHLRLMSVPCIKKPSAGFVSQSLESERWDAELFLFFDSLPKKPTWNLYYILLSAARNRNREESHHEKTLHNPL